MKRLNLFLALLYTTIVAIAPISAQPSLAEIHVSNSSLQFIANKNQFHSNVEYLCMLSAMDRVYLEQDGFTYVFHEHENFHECHADNHCDEDHHDKILAHAYKVNFVGANVVSPSGDKKMNHHRNYFIGNDKSKWASNVPIYQLAEYKKLYEGIDLKTYSENGFF